MLDDTCQATIFPIGWDRLPAPCLLRGDPTTAHFNESQFHMNRDIVNPSRGEASGSYLVSEDMPFARCIALTCRDEILIYKHVWWD